MKKFIFLSVMMVMLSLQYSLAQGVTTASMRGTVTDASGEVLPGATVIAIHEPTGVEYGTSTRLDGRFNLPNLKVGGPYKVTVSFVGYQPKEFTNIKLVLGETFTLNPILDPDVKTLEEIVVSGKNDDTFNADRTGAEIAFSNEQITKLPTITRSAGDIYRLTPSSDGNSFGGRNDQYNNFSLDGSIFNNPFGLDAATPGGQADAQPISLDAIDQIQVAVAPYDVTQSGFTGASVNAVTKSGTNDFHGTVFGFFRNNDMIGGKVEGEDVIQADLSQVQAGFSLGGPVIENKLFFFTNFELDRRQDLGSSFVANRGTGAANESRVLATDLERVSDLLEDRFGYITGPYEDFTLDTRNEKGIVKLDYNINNSHTLTATYNFLRASKEKPAHPTALGRRGPDANTLQFKNSGYTINNNIDSWLVELRSLFGNRFSNKFQAGYTLFDDSRDPFSTPFPPINLTKDGSNYIIVGHEPFSINNRLEQKVLQLSDNFEIYSGDHTFTLGASFEKFSFANSFNLTSYGFSVFGSTDLEDFITQVNNGEWDGPVQDAINTFETNNANDSWALAETEVGQLAFYAQDKWLISDKFTLTLGLRFDKPLYFNTSDNIVKNEDVVIYYDEDNDPVIFDNTDLPNNNLLVSPRLGFNWDVANNGKTQIRGGSGIFTGRLPFVWIGNQVANPFTGFLNVTAPNFKFPQVWRSSLGIDRVIASGLVATVDLSYTKDLNSMLVRDYSLRTPTGQLQGVDQRGTYTGADIVTFGGGRAANYVFTNTDKGRSFNLTLELKKKWENGLYASLAYNYLDAKSVSSIESEISSDAFSINPIVTNANKAVLSPSLYGNKHRVVGNLNKTFNYGNDHWATTVSLFFEYARGGRYSYTYAGDINGDGSGLNDLIYIPTDAELNQMDFVSDANREAYRAYIEQDDYLKENRGAYAERYGALSPWYSRFDFRLLQDYKLNNGNKIQFSLDILNAGNLISSDWGIRQIPRSVQPLSVAVDGGGNPTYTFNESLNSTFVTDTGLISRWQMQLGLRYTF
ncbi:TonB-dependent receptor [Fulvivirga ligni]|uniref:TonB-dependent receptor n=1 Tax=Fulvivirga ligni TaxID=2904246 RepID=UPI001F3E280F|nr:carboxypeptidase regulatory-like domain-containing protein [Fulvivirga ligni]UII21811.1 TonB-dependent receptor [Fulvivirga ligni]